MIARTAALCLLVTVVGCTSQPAANEEVASPPVELIERITAAQPFNAADRHFVLRPFGEVHTHLQYHARNVHQFVRRPGQGVGRGLPLYTLDEWVEVVPEGPEFPRTKPIAEVKPDAEPPTAWYDNNVEVLNYPDGRSRKARPRVWRLIDRQLVSANRETGPAAYVQNNANVHLHDGTEQIATGRNTPTRPLDPFEVAALADVRSGSNLIVRTVGDNMQMFGAVRAAAECRSCHNCETDALLGAFTYHFVLQSEATPDEARLADRGGLSTEELTAVDAIEAIGGQVTRQPGGPVTGVHLSFARDSGKAKEPRPEGDRLQITNVSLELLRPLTHLKSLEIRDSLVDDRGMNEIIALKNLQRLILHGNFYITEAGLKELQAMTQLRHLDLRNIRWNNDSMRSAIEELKLALPDCEVVHDGKKATSELPLTPP